MIEQRYPDRTKFSFDDASTGTSNTYLCKNLGGMQETQKRAKTAHLYVSKRINEISSKAAEKMFNAEKFSYLCALKSSAAINKGAKHVAKEVEEKYQCLFIDAKD